MPPLHMVCEITSFVVGCESCGQSIEVKPIEAELLPRVWVHNHLGPFLSAALMSVEGGPFEWVGDETLVEGRAAAVGGG